MLNFFGHLKLVRNKLVLDFSEIEPGWKYGLQTIVVGSTLDLRCNNVFKVANTLANINPT